MNAVHACCTKRCVVQVVFLSAMASFAATRYVALNGTHVAPFDTWATAATNIQDAVDAAALYDQVLVTNGLYQLASNTQVVVTKRITLASVNRHGAVIRSHPDLGRCLFLSAMGAVVDGFVLTGGRTLNMEGGGVYLQQYGTLQNCLVTGNYASGNFMGAYGGGIYVKNGGLVSNCIVRANQSDGSGAGVYLYRGGAAVFCTIIENHSGYMAGGISLQYGTIAHNCLIARNTALYGGGVDTYSTSVIQNCTISDNRAWRYGGGIRSGSDATYENCIIFGNEAPEQAETVDGYARLVNCCVAPGIINTNVSSLITGDPEFADPPSNDYRLLPGSSCVDAGGNRAWMGTNIDLDGRPRILHGTVDIGSYEADQTVPACNFIAARRQQFIGQPVVFQPHMWAFTATTLTCDWDFTNDGVVDATTYGLAAVTATYGAQGVYSVRMRMSDGHAARTRLRYDYITIGPAEAYVAHGGAHVAPYLTWSQAARDIQSAVDTAVDGTVIYVSNELFRVTNEIVLAKGVRVKSVDAGMAVLDGGLPGRTGRCVYVSHADARVEGFVIQCSGYPYYGSTGGAVLVWLGGSIERCVLASNVAGFGAAIYTYRGGQILDCVISNSYTPGYGIGSAFCDGNAQIRNSLFVDNRTYNAGGLYAIGSLVSNCLFVGNVARGIYGGLRAMSGFGGRSLVQQCLISNNIALDNRAGGIWVDLAVMEDSLITCNYASNNYSYGGGVLLSGGVMRRCVVTHNRSDYAAGVSSLDGMVLNCVITRNSAIGPKTGRSGGLEANRGEVRNCLIAHNTALTDGGGARFAGGIFYLANTTLFVNCTIVSNRAGGLGGGLYLDTGATGNLFNTIIAANIAPIASNCHVASTNWTIRHCCATPLLDGAGNVAADPLFVNPHADDWRLSAASPCRDAGSTAPWMSSDTDLAGLPRVLYGAVDMGAYEYAEGLWCTFTATPLLAILDEPVAFASTVGGTNTSGLNYVWDFNNDGTADVQGPGEHAPVWQYASTGSYSVSLCVSNAASEHAAWVRMDYITVVPEPGGWGMLGICMMYSLQLTIWRRRGEN